MIHIQYESPIDSIEDLLKTNLQVFVDATSAMAKLLSGDRRQSMIEMKKRVNHYTNTVEEGYRPSWISKG